jgi:hypothetical protein
LKKGILLVVGFLICASLADARPPNREDTFASLEALQVRAMLTSGQVPLLTLVLSASKRANPAVSDESWAEINEEILADVTKNLVSTGSDLDHAFRLAVKDFSDDDLRRVDAILADPLYRRFQLAIVAPSVIQVFLALQNEINKSLLPEVNRVFVKRGIPPTK